jgi:hexosaminidase
MDVPGHSTAMISALPEVFGFPSAPTLGIANFANQTVISRLQTLFSEIDTVLPSPFVAIGGDEVSFPAVSHLPEVLEALRSNDLSGVADLYRLFIVEMRSYAVSKNKTLRVWVREDTTFNQYVIFVSLKYDRIIISLLDLHI